MSTADHEASFCCGEGEGFTQAAYDLIVDQPMWIDGQGRGLDYSPEREKRIGDFLDALLPLVRAYGDGRAAAAIAALPPADTETLRDVLLKHHPIAHTMTGPLKGCRCGQVKLGQDVIAHVAAALLAALPLSPAEEAVNVEGDWIYPSRELHARDLTKSWADAAQNAGCPASFVARMRSFVEVHDRLYRAALASPAPAPQSPTAAKIRDRVDAMAPRVHDDGSINAQHVAIEQTLRERHGLPSYVADLDGPGRFRRAPVPQETWTFQTEEVPVPTAFVGRDRYAQCDDTCTADCGACKGAGRPARQGEEGQR